MNKKLLFILIGIVVILLTFAAYKANSGSDPISVTAEKVKKRTIIETVAANGKVQPEVEVKISPDASGEVIELPVKEGDKVQKGDLLAKINPDIYISIRDRTEASLNTSRANLANAKARLAQVKAKMINAEADFSRNEKLFNQGAISQADFDAAKSAFEVAKAEVEAAEQNVIGSEFSVKSAEASLKEAQNNLLKTTIFSPVEGTVSMLNVEQGERVVGTSQMAGTEMMRIADLSTMEANVEVNENDIVKVNLGDKVEIEVDAYLGRKFKGIVMEMANSANREGMNVDQVTTFDVKIRILRESYEDLVSKENPHLSPFRPGMTATVEIQTEIAYDVLTVPIQTVTTREDSAGVDEKSGVTEKDREAENREEKDEEIVECVFVLKDDSAKKVEVKTGIQDSKHIEILSGLEEGQEVISGPYSAISKELIDGDLVEKTEKKDLFKKRRKRQ